METKQVKRIVEAALLASEQPLNIDQLSKLFAGDEERATHEQIKEVIAQLEEEDTDRGFELVRVANGYRYQTRVDVQKWVVRLWEEKPPRYSRALLETLALIVYRQPITRAEIEEVRGVNVSTSIIKTLLEREWVRVVGHKEVPGRPALYGSTSQFLDYFNLRSLNELPSLKELSDFDKVHLELELDHAPPAEDQPVQLQVIPGGLDTFH